MAAFSSRVFRLSLGLKRNNAKVFLQEPCALVNSVRTNFFFKHNAEIEVPSKGEWSFEVSKDPEEWKYVENLMPMMLVPEPTPKSHYPSGWRPMKEESLKHPYFVERSRNHMLSVYLFHYNKGVNKLTRVVKIRGDIWKLHNELKAHIQEQVGKKIASYVLEGNNEIRFRGDYVYYVEQWLLSKGF